MFSFNTIWLNQRNISVNSTKFWSTLTKILVYLTKLFSKIKKIVFRCILIEKYFTSMNQKLKLFKLDIRFRNQHYTWKKFVLEIRNSFLKIVASRKKKSQKKKFDGTFKNCNIVNHDIFQNFDHRKITYFETFILF